MTEGHVVNSEVKFVWLIQLCELTRESFQKNNSGLKLVLSQSDDAEKNTSHCIFESRFYHGPLDFFDIEVVLLLQLFKCQDCRCAPPYST